MTELLSKHYNTWHAKEIGREVCSDTNTCSKDMITKIIIGQAKEIKNNLGKKILFSDTDLITTICYSEFLFNEYPENITKEIQELNNFDLYLYLWNDVPFVDDGSRMGEPKRSKFHKLLFEKFKDKNIVVITGNYEERFNKCIEIVDKFISEN
jgi:HTH-type transcriptional repressor of NAD biosynthesis genes